MFFGKTDLPKVVEWQSLPRNTFSARLSPPTCELKTSSAIGSTVIWQSYSTSRIPFGERLGTRIFRLTGSSSGK
ncbi:unnamed protein product [Coregonus sp. 'balchen']|nr:unnamed protein product [Coregonus sp. 'balchen']